MKSGKSSKNKKKRLHLWFRKTPEKWYGRKRHSPAGSYRKRVGCN